MDAELLQVVTIACKAAKLVRSIYDTPFTVEMKGPGDPVTRADREANDLICHELSVHFPGDAILAEESAPADRADVAAIVRQERVFFVDPLDGTREFADKVNEFAVMIGLAASGRPVLGVVVFPTTGEAIFGRAVPPQGAFRRDDLGRITPVHPSPLADPTAATLVISRSHRPRLIDPIVRQLGIKRVVPCGSVGVKVARVAAGEAELYVHGSRGIKLWDTCAPEAILLAAGGRFTDLYGGLIDYSWPDLMLPDGVVASNGPLHDAVLNVTGQLTR